MQVAGAAARRRFNQRVQFHWPSFIQHRRRWKVFSNFRERLFPRRNGGFRQGKTGTGGLRHLFCSRGGFFPLLQSRRPQRFQLIRSGSEVAFDRAELISLAFPGGEKVFQAKVGRAPRLPANNTQAIPLTPQLTLPLPGNRQGGEFILNFARASFFGVTSFHFLVTN
jgi:hypothetical protein